jgi:hypothetical protein
MDQQEIISLTKGPLNVVSAPDRPAREPNAEDAKEITPGMELDARAADGEVIGPENPIDAVGRLLVRELSHKAVIPSTEWDDLLEGDREAFRAVIEGLLLSWDLIEKAKSAHYPSASMQ